MGLSALLLPLISLGLVACVQASAPPKFDVHMVTSLVSSTKKYRLSAGFHVERAWCPEAVDRIHALLEAGKYTPSAISSVTRNKLQATVFLDTLQTIEPLKSLPKNCSANFKFKKGVVGFMGSSPQLVFVIGKTAKQIQEMKDFYPFGSITSGHDVLMRGYAHYPRKDVQAALKKAVNLSDVVAEFPKLDSITSTVIQLPDVRVRCTTSKGDFVVRVFHAWAPIAAQRFLDMVNDEFFTDIPVHRVIPKFMVQFGYPLPEVKRRWASRFPFNDDPFMGVGVRTGTIAFESNGVNNRTSNLVIALQDKSSFFIGTKPGHAPFAMVVRGIDTLRSLYDGYGDIQPFGKGPNTTLIEQYGNAYLQQNYPALDYIEDCFVEGTRQPKASRRHLTDWERYVEDNLLFVVTSSLGSLFTLIFGAYSAGRWSAAKAAKAAKAKRQRQTGQTKKTAAEATTKKGKPSTDRTTKKDKPLTDKSGNGKAGTLRKRK